MTVRYKKLADDVISASYDLAEEKDWGAPRLRRIFNFTAQQVVTLYERGGKLSYDIPQGYNYGSGTTGYNAAVTSSMQVQNFDDLPNQDDIAAMHGQLKELGGKPPALDTILGRLNKPKAGLKS